MNESLTLKRIGLEFLNRIINPSLENRAIGAFLVVGMALIWMALPFSVQGNVAFDLPHLRGNLSASNEPSWVLFSIGIGFMLYGGFALYKLKISISNSKRAQIGQLLLLLEQNKRNLNNLEVQQYFVDLFGIKASVPVIRHLLTTEDPSGNIEDYRRAGKFVALNDLRFVASSQVNHRSRARLYSWCYSIVSAAALTLVAIPLSPYLEASTRNTLSTVGYPIALLMALGAAFLLNPIGAHYAAMRLLATSSGDLPEKVKDERTVRQLLSEIHSSSLDNFVQQGKLHIIIDSVFHYWFGFDAIVRAPKFHLHDRDLLRTVEGFHRAWARSLGFDRYFLPASNGHFHRFDSRQLAAGNSEAEFAHREFAASIVDVDRLFRQLLTEVRERFPRIDLDETDAAALEDFQRSNSTARHIHAPIAVDESKRRLSADVDVDVASATSLRGK